MLVAAVFIAAIYFVPVIVYFLSAAVINWLEKGYKNVEEKHYAEHRV